MNNASPESPGIKRLILMRHAKSDWGDESASDHERKLNPRGKRDAPRIAGWLAEVEQVPDCILCSSAARTRQTVKLMVAQWDRSPLVSYCDDLYLASPETMLRTIHRDGGDAATLMVVAHNPGISQLASMLSDRATDMPTAAVAVFEAELGDWSELRLSSPLQLVQRMRPKAL